MICVLLICWCYFALVYPPYRVGGFKKKGYGKAYIKLHFFMMSQQ